MAHKSYSFGVIQNSETTIQYSGTISFSI